MKTITVLVPAYNEEQSVPLFYEELRRITDGLPQYRWDVLFVDDGSTDGTADALRRLREADSRVRWLHLSRNFGKESAMLAGFDYADGDATIIMDCDLQDPVDVIPELLSAYEEGFQDVYARRRTRGREPLLRKWLTRLYYSLLQRSARFDVLPNVGDFRLLDRRCVLALRSLRETQRYTKGLFCWIGFRKKEVLFDRDDRRMGRSNFTYRSLVRLALDGLTSFTTAPLRLSMLCGVLVSLAAFVYLVYVVAKTLLFGEPVQGYPTLVTLILFLGGMQLLALGIIGEYVARIYNEAKRRPVYLVDAVNGETTNSNR
ncbi:MAG: glycosyltransferase family 2 protein [Alloprevotella sp.]|nr:glycosyltransferase family 2 protein [Alloprevotella sp.]